MNSILNLNLNSKGKVCLDKWLNFLITSRDLNEGQIWVLSNLRDGGLNDCDGLSLIMRGQVGPTGQAIPTLGMAWWVLRILVQFDGS